MDHIQLIRSAQHELKECCSLIVETWLLDNIPDSAIQLAGLTCLRTDRVCNEGGICVYISYAWSQNAGGVHNHCSSLVEFICNSKISGHFCKSLSLWQGIQTLTNYKPLQRTFDSDISILIASA